MAFKMKGFPKHKGVKKTKLKDLRSNDKNIDLDKGENMPVRKSGFGPTSKASAFGGVDNPEMQGRSKSGAPKKGPCWEGYEMVGMKKKSGRSVPNCVPKKK
jgi:spore coat protein CotH